MAQLFANNASTTLASQLTAGATSASVVDGAAFPTFTNSDADYASVGVIYKFNGNLNDSKGNANLTANGGASTTTVTKKFGTHSLALISASSQYVSVTSSSVSLFSATTLEGWFYLTSYTGAQTLFMLADNGLGYEYFYVYVEATTGYLKAWSQKAYAGSYNISSTTAVPLNTWVHIAFTRNGATGYLFVNGVQAAADGAVTWPTSLGTTRFSIGSRQPIGAADYLNGYVDSVRVTNGVCRYTGAFTPPADEFPAADADHFLATLTQGTGTETSWEIVKCTARSGNTLTIVRAQEGTADTTWAAGSKVELRLTGSGVSEKVSAPAVAVTSGNIAVFDGTSGKLLMDGGQGLPTGSLVGTLATQTLSGKTLTGLLETRVAVSTNIDLAAGNYFTKTISGTTTFTVSNVPASGTATSFILDLTNGAVATINWWTGVKWVGGTAPTLTVAGRDALGFFTHDGGTTWSGLVLGRDIK